MNTDYRIKNPMYLKSSLGMIKKRIISADKIMLFLDYDGTLVSFKNNPDDVKTPKKIIEIIKNIQKKKNFDIIIITGRTLKDIGEKIPIHHMNYAALHGLHIRKREESRKIITNLSHLSSQLDSIKNELKSSFSDIKGVVFEDKNLTFAFHYRNVDDELKPLVKNRFSKFYKDRINKDSFHIINGDNVFEIKPKGWDKGKAVDYFYDKNNGCILPIYIGDDTTDEDAFLTLKDKGITVYVKNHSNLQTNASYWLSDPNEVYEFLEYLHDL